VSVNVMESGNRTRFRRHDIVSRCWTPIAVRIMSSRASAWLSITPVGYETGFRVLDDVKHM
jgi:hypothetical protein